MLRLVAFSCALAVVHIASRATMTKIVFFILNELFLVLCLLFSAIFGFLAEVLSIIREKRKRRKHILCLSFPKVPPSDLHNNKHREIFTPEGANFQSTCSCYASEMLCHFSIEIGGFRKENKSRSSISKSRMGIRSFSEFYPFGKRTACSTNLPISNLLYYLFFFIFLIRYYKSSSF